jgi:hypothetical protein
MSFMPLFGAPQEECMLGAGIFGELRVRAITSEVQIIEKKGGKKRKEKGENEREIYREFPLLFFFPPCFFHPYLFHLLDFRFTSYFLCFAFIPYIILFPLPPLHIFARPSSKVPRNGVK